AAGITALRFRALGIDALFEAERAQYDVEPVTGIIVAQFLAVLILLRGILRQANDIEAAEIPVVFRFPVPETPGRNGSQGSGTNIPDGAQRSTTNLVSGIQSGIQIGHSIERIKARRQIA